MVAAILFVVALQRSDSWKRSWGTECAPSLAIDVSAFPSRVATILRMRNAHLMQTVRSSSLKFQAAAVIWCNPISKDAQECSDDRHQDKEG